MFSASHSPSQNPHMFSVLCFKGNSPHTYQNLQGHMTVIHRCILGCERWSLLVVIASFCRHHLPQPLTQSVQACQQKSDYRSIGMPYIGMASSCISRVEGKDSQCLLVMFSCSSSTNGVQARCAWVKCPVAPK